MPYYTRKALEKLGFKSLGKGVKVSTNACIYNYNEIDIGDYSRIDDLCVISGKVKIGRNVHITPMCLIAGGDAGIILEDFTTVAYGVKIFAQSDDYSGKTMTNSTVPVQYKSEFKAQIVIEKYSIIGAGSVIMPGVLLGEGTSIGAMSLVLKSTSPWGVYVGNPAKKLRDRDKGLLLSVERYLSKARDENTF